MNKNTKQLKAAVRLARRAGKRELEWQVPVRDWHNREKPEFNTIRVTTGFVKPKESRKKVTADN